MSHLKYQPDRDLHHADGSHRTTPATANGTVLANHERRIRAHLELHKAEQHIATALAVANEKEQP